MMHSEFFSPSCFQMVHIKKKKNSFWKFSHACTLELLSQQEEPNLNSLSSMIACSIAADCRSVLSRSHSSILFEGCFFFSSSWEL